MNDFVYDLVVDRDGTLYVGGMFTTAGDKGAPFVAKALVRAPAVRDLTPSSHGIKVRFLGIPGQRYDVQRASDLTPPVTWMTITRVPLRPEPDGTFSFTDTNAPSARAYYRLRRSP